MTGPGPRTVTEMAEAVRSGRSSARALTEAALDRIARHDRDLGAFQLVRGERALDEAAAIDARPDLAQLPLAGVPIAIKDNVAVAGEPKREGSAATDPRPQIRDHPVVERLRSAGAVVVGLTRVPELCVFGATDSVFGVTRNPWNLSRTPGGSSGGSAAAVAAGLVPAAHGNDGMGSIRIPAACCGLVGIKPGSGVVPSELGADSWFGLAENGPLTTTVADSALLLSVLAARPELAGTAAPPSERLRVAVSVRAPAPATPVDSDFAAAARRTGELLARVGHQVAEQEPRYPMSMGPASLALWTAGTDRDARLVANPHLLEKRVARHAAAGRAVQRARLLPGSARESWRRVARDFFADVDVLVTPALAQPPIASARWGERGWMRNLVANTSYAPFASPWNLAGWPAMTVPAGVHPDSRTPLAVQLVAPPGNEARLLAVAAQLEALAPWPRVAPVYA